jgi:hypothetical protein
VVQHIFKIFKNLDLAVTDAYLKSSIFNLSLPSAFLFLNVLNT